MVCSSKQPHNEGHQELGWGVMVNDGDNSLQRIQRLEPLDVGRIAVASPTAVLGIPINTCLPTFQSLFLYFCSGLNVKI